MSELIHATAPSPARHLLELVGNQRPPLPSIPLAHAADDDRTGRHVDTEGEGVRGEHNLHQSPAEQHLDKLLEYRQETGMMKADALAGKPGDDLNLGKLAIFRAQAFMVGVEPVSYTHLR